MIRPSLHYSLQKLGDNALPQVEFGVWAWKMEAQDGKLDKKAEIGQLDQNHALLRAAGRVTDDRRRTEIERASERFQRKETSLARQRHQDSTKREKAAGERKQASRRVPVAAVGAIEIRIPIKSRQIMGPRKEGAARGSFSVSRAFVRV